MECLQKRGYCTGVVTIRGKEEKRVKASITLLPNLKFMPPTCIAYHSHVVMDKQRQGVYLNWLHEVVH